MQKHGEVFTPQKIVNKMLNTPEVKAACENISSKFLEPSAGEGIFLMKILERKLEIVKNKYNEDLNQFENYSLLALSTLYGIELLEDNAQTCVMNLFQTYYEFYQEQAHFHQKKVNNKVLNSAKEIISSNIEQGNFLTRKTAGGDPLIFSEWLPINHTPAKKNIKIQRTDYTLNEIFQNSTNELGNVVNDKNQEFNQLNIFDLLSEEKIKVAKMKYTLVNIKDVYKVEMEEQ